MYDDSPTMVERLARQRITELTSPARPRPLGSVRRPRRRAALANTLRRAADRLDS